MKFSVLRKYGILCSPLVAVAFGCQCVSLGAEDLQCKKRRSGQPPPSSPSPKRSVLGVRWGPSDCVPEFEEVFAGEVQALFFHLYTKDMDFFAGEPRHLRSSSFSS